MALSLRNHVIQATSSKLDLFLSELDERRGRISCSREVNIIQSRVSKVIRSILLDVRRENPFFRTTLINSGSFYEGTKVGQQDEFDYFIQLDSFSSAEDTLFEELPCSTVAVVPSESAIEHLKLYSTDDQGHRMLYFNDFERKKSIKTPFFKIFNEKAKGFEAYGMKVVLASPAGIWRGRYRAFTYGWRNGAKFTKFIFIHIQCCYCYSRIYLFIFNN